MKKLIALSLLLNSLTINAMENHASINSQTPKDLANRLVEAQGNRLLDDTLPDELFGPVSDVLANVKPAKIAACLKVVHSFNKELFDAAVSYFVQKAILDNQKKSTFDKWFKDENNNEMDIKKALSKEFDRQTQYKLTGLFENQDYRYIRPILISPDWLSDKVKNEALYCMDGSNANYVKALNMTHYSHLSSTLPVAFSSNGQYVASASDKGIQLYDLNLKQITHTFPGEAHSVALSPDGNYLAAASSKTVKLYDLNSKQLINSIKHDIWVTSVAFSPDSNYLATGSNDGNVKLYDLNLKHTTTVTPPRTNTLIRSIAFSPNSNSLAIASDNVEVYDLNQKKISDTINYDHFDIYRVVFSPDSNYIAATSDAIALVYDLKQKKFSDSIKHHRHICSVAFSPDGNYFATGSQDGTAKLYDLKQKKVIDTIWHKGMIPHIDFSLDGNYLTTISRDGTAQIYDLKLKQTIGTIKHYGWATHITFSADGNYIATAAEDAQIWNWKQWHNDITQEVSDLNLEQLKLLNCLHTLEYMSESDAEVISTLPPLIKSCIEKYIKRLELVVKPKLKPTKFSETSKCTIL